MASDEYRANVLAEIEEALKAGKREYRLREGQMRQLLDLFDAVVKAKNELIREKVKERSQSA